MQTKNIIIFYWLLLFKCDTKGSGNSILANRNRRFIKKCEKIAEFPPVRYTKKEVIISVTDGIRYSPTKVFICGN